MCQIGESGKTRRNIRVIEIVESKVEDLQVRKGEKATVGGDAAMKPTTTKVKASHMTSHHVTCYSIP